MYLTIENMDTERTTRLPIHDKHIADEIFSHVNRCLCNRRHGHFVLRKHRNSGRVVRRMLIERGDAS